MILVNAYITLEIRTGIPKVARHCQKKISFGEWRIGLFSLWSFTNLPKASGSIGAWLASPSVCSSERVIVWTSNTLHSINPGNVTDLISLLPAINKTWTDKGIKPKVNRWIGGKWRAISYTLHILQATLLGIKKWRSNSNGETSSQWSSAGKAYTVRQCPVLLTVLRAYMFRTCHLPPMMLIWWLRPKTKVYVLTLDEVQHTYSYSHRRASSVPLV